MRSCGRIPRLPCLRLRHQVRRICFFTSTEKAAFHEDGFVLKPNVLSTADCIALANHYKDLFAGRFPTHTFPDEWHWRENLSLPTAVREIVNGWKSSPAVARVALSPNLGRAASALLDWTHGARLGQDDVLWKPAGAGGVGFHQDSAYISDQFLPRDDNSVTVWIALDDADESTGTVEYAVGSHRWRRQAEQTSTSTSTSRGGDPSSQAVEGDGSKGDVASNAVNSSFHASDGDVAEPARIAARAAGLAPSAVELRSVAVPRGGAVFHHQDCWHGSRANTHTRRPRRALAIHLVRRDVVFRRSPPPDYIYGRYVLGRGSTRVSDAFFPVVWAPDGSHANSDAARLLRRSGLVPHVDEEPTTLIEGAEQQDEEEAVGGSEKETWPRPPLIAAWEGSGTQPGRTVVSMLDAWRQAGEQDEAEHNHSLGIDAL